MLPTQPPAGADAMITLPRDEVFNIAAWRRNLEEEESDEGAMEGQSAATLSAAALGAAALLEHHPSLVQRIATLKRRADCFQEGLRKAAAVGVTERLIALQGLREAAYAAETCRRHAAHVRYMLRTSAAASTATEAYEPSPTASSPTAAEADEPPNQMSSTPPWAPLPKAMLRN